jgi:hypothetical protein
MAVAAPAHSRLNKKAQEAVNKLRKWREDPLLFVREVFGVEPDEWQKDVLQAFPKHQRIAMQACKGPGKTALEAWCAWNFLATRPSPKIAATSITSDNLSDNLWPEMAKWQARSSFLKEKFIWTKTRIVNRESPENWFMSARSWPKSGDSTQQADTLAGIHADYVMFILDESGGIPDAVMAAAEAALASGVESKILQGGNPTMLSGPLYRAATSERNLWHVTEITGDPDDPRRSPRVSAQWAREQIEKYGRDNPWVMVNVFGKFPPSSLNALFSADEIDEAMSRLVKEPDYKYSQRRLGLDVARFGDDRTIDVIRQGRRVFPWVENRGLNGPEVAAHVLTRKRDERVEVTFVDDTGGYGASAIDQMVIAGESPLAINFSGKAIDPRYVNKRAEMYFTFSQWIKTGALPKDAGLKKELLAQEYFFSGNKMQLVDKDQIKDKLGFSPDVSDAIALTFALPEQGSSLEGAVQIAPGMYLTRAGYVQEVHRPKDNDWNPYSDERMRDMFGD